jgi:hypothetical protein
MLLHPAMANALATMQISQCSRNAWILSAAEWCQHKLNRHLEVKEENPHGHEHCVIAGVAPAPFAVGYIRSVCDAWPN